MASTAAEHHDHHDVGFVSKYIFSTDHKMIAVQYYLTGIFMAFVGGYLSYVFRYALGFPGTDPQAISVPFYGTLTSHNYNMMGTMHGTIMIFWVAMPVLLGALGNFTIPLLIGAEDMAFPALNMMSYWTFFLSTVVLLLSFFVPSGAYHGGWTAYPPLSADNYATGGNIDLAASLVSGGTLWILAVALEFVSMLMGGINYFVTTVNMRAPGMKFTDLPLAIWYVNIASIVFMFSVGPLVAGAIMLLLDRTLGTGFYDPKRGGDPVLFQHFFWFFGHPEVYVLLWPALGIIAEVITTFARKTVFGYKFILGFTVMSAFLSCIVWAHHQFVSGIDPRMAAYFSVTTIIISIPFAAIMFAYLATLKGGSIEFRLPMMWAVAFLAEFLVGGVTGIYLGSSGFDIYAHSSYFVIAHFHYTLIPITIFASMAGTTYWFPKITGRMFNETIGKIHFWLTIIFFNATFFPLFISGMRGEHRRIMNYVNFPSLDVPNQEIRMISTIALIGLFLTQFIFLVGLIVSVKTGEKAGKNPWKANALAWITDSPPPHGNFETQPTVYRGPYEYSVPGRASDYWPQDEKP